MGFAQQEREKNLRLFMAELDMRGIMETQKLMITVFK